MTKTANDRNARCPMVQDTAGKVSASLSLVRAQFIRRLNSVTLEYAEPANNPRSSRP